jgi:hypothetical protein
MSELALERPKGYGLVFQMARMTRLVFHSVLDTLQGCDWAFQRVATTKMASKIRWVEVEEWADCSMVQTLELALERPTGSDLVLQMARMTRLVLHLPPGRRKRLDWEPKTCLVPALVLLISKLLDWVLMIGLDFGSALLISLAAGLVLKIG